MKIITAILLFVIATAANADGVVKLDGAMATFGCIAPTTRSDGTPVRAGAEFTFKLYATQKPPEKGTLLAVTSVCTYTMSTAGLALGQWHSYWTATETLVAPETGGGESLWSNDAPFVTDLTPVTVAPASPPTNATVK